MENAIRQFIQDEVQKHQYFDSHTVIEYLIQNYTDLYLQGAGGNQLARTYHGQIAQKISILEQVGIVKKVGDKASVSKNITDKFTTCALWQKL